MLANDVVDSLIARWRADSSSTWQNWFLWEERIKNFRTIRRGLQMVVAEIEADSFGNAYRESSLETVVHSIAEQRQIFKGADHAFLWKPKLRIPDIYEDRKNQQAFGHFLKTCLHITTQDGIVNAIHELNRCKIKGLGPACANLLYFLHPTLATPFNTAIVKGYNLLTGSKVKLGCWEQYLAMRNGIIKFNEQHRRDFSNDLGAVAGFLFDLGCGRYPLPATELNSPEAIALWQAELAKIQEESLASRKLLEKSSEQTHTHTRVQSWLRDVGQALGYRIWIANNDRTRLHEGGQLGDGCLACLPDHLNSVNLIDVLWLDSDSQKVIAAFEVEHTSTIYSGIVRMLDLALGVPDHTDTHFFLVAPGSREKDVRAQFSRSAFNRVRELDMRYLPYEVLDEHREAICRFGSGMKALDAIALRLE
ncbi:type II restriction enzyme [Buttiauxella noackiae]|uniref:type II restriction enzyme n=1 Tax=Buttiauxella noackiae TaxID=82992 RepID=UPI0005588BA2|nr:type II restriction enzyme [Buttiauxella noackiae]